LITGHGPICCRSYIEVDCTAGRGMRSRRHMIPRCLLSRKHVKRRYTAPFTGHRSNVGPVATCSRFNSAHLCLTFTAARSIPVPNRRSTMERHPTYPPTFPRLAWEYAFSQRDENDPLESPNSCYVTIPPLPERPTAPTTCIALSALAKFGPLGTYPIAWPDNIPPIAGPGDHALPGRQRSPTKGFEHLKKGPPATRPPHRGAVGRFRAYTAAPAQCRPGIRETQMGTRRWVSRPFHALQALSGLP
jgi:hypothetical protein